MSRMFSIGPWYTVLLYTLLLCFSQISRADCSCPPSCIVKFGNTLVCAHVDYQELPEILRCDLSNGFLKELHLDTRGYSCDCVWQSFVGIVVERGVSVRTTTNLADCAQTQQDMCDVHRRLITQSLPSPPAEKGSQLGDHNGRTKPVSQMNHSFEQKLRGDGRADHRVQLVVFAASTGLIFLSAVVLLCISMDRQQRQGYPPKMNTSYLEVILYPERFRYSCACMRPQVERRNERVPSGAPFLYP